MRITRQVLAGAVAAVAIAAVAVPAGAHQDPSGDPNFQSCATLALPAQVNNVEMAGSAHAKAPGNGGHWRVAGPGGSTYQTDMDLTAAKVGTAGTGPASITIGGHGGQIVNQGRYGLYYPVTDPNGTHADLSETSPNGLPNWKGDHFNWSQTGQCVNNGGTFTAQGTGVGYCGRSVGLGTGSAPASSGPAHTTIIRWESFATQLILTDPSATGSVNAQGNAPGSPNGSCSAGTATTFIVDGVINHS